jgi:hypothetical protein
MIIRTPRPHRYAIIPNDAVQNHALSFKARGILAYLLSQPDHWTISSNALANMAAQDGREAIRTGLVELENAGYLVRRRVQDPTTGRWGWHQVLYDQPVHKRVDNDGDNERAEVRLPDVGKLNVYESTEQKVLSERNLRDSYASEVPALCKVCNGGGYHIWEDGVEQCPACNGDGIHRRR